MEMNQNTTKHETKLLWATISNKISNNLKHLLYNSNNIKTLKIVLQFAIDQKRKRKYKKQTKTKCREKESNEKKIK